MKGAGESGQRRFERLMDRLLRRLRLEEYIDLSATAASVRVPADEVLYAEVLNHRMRLLTRAGEFLLRMTVEELKPIPRTRPRLPQTAACSPPSTGARA